MKIEHCLRQLEKEKQLTLLPQRAYSLQKYLEKVPELELEQSFVNTEKLPSNQTEKVIADDNLTRQAKTELEPEKIYEHLNNYISEINRLHSQLSNSRKQLKTKSLGLVTITQELEKTTVELLKDGEIIYQAQKTDSWQVTQNLLESSQIEVISSLPQDQAEILLDLEASKLTEKLQKAFEIIGYQKEQTLHLDSLAVPYSFAICPTEEPNNFVFIGTNSHGEEIFKSQLTDEGIIKIQSLEMDLKQVQQLNAEIEKSLQIESEIELEL